MPVDEFIKTKGAEWRCSVCRPPYNKGGGWNAGRHCDGPKHQSAAIKARLPTTQPTVSATAAAAAVAAATAAAAAERNNPLTPARAVAAAALSSIASVSSASASVSSASASTVLGSASAASSVVAVNDLKADVPIALSSAAVPSTNVSPFMLSPGVMGMESRCDGGAAAGVHCRCRITREETSLFISGANNSMSCITCDHSIGFHPSGLYRTVSPSFSGSASASASAAVGINQPQGVTSNPVLLHPLSSAGRKAFTKASNAWDKRKRNKHKSSKQERSTFFAASYELTEPLLSQFSRYLLSTTAPKRKTKRTAEEVNHVTTPQPTAVFLLALILFGVLYERWLTKQLMPSLMALYPGKRVVLVIDGAGYHRAVPKELAARKHKTKQDHIEYLERLGVIDPPHTPTLTVVRDGALHSIPIARVNTMAPVRPYVAELALMVRAYKRALPPVHVSELFDAPDDRHAVLYTPPGGMEEQPIEKLWAKTKNAVAAQYYQRRSIAETRQQLMTAFDTCDATFCGKLIEHAQKEMNGMIRFQPLLKGTIGALECDIAQSDADVVEYVNQFMLNPPPKRHRKLADDSGESSSSSDDPPAAASLSQPRVATLPPPPAASLPPLPPLAPSLSHLGVARSSHTADTSAAERFR